MKKTLLLCLFFFAILASSQAAFAQIKIGNNITKVDPNASLEVEGVTNGRRFRIDKSTGQLTIRDGSQEYGRVLTSDSQGRASWKQIQTSSLAPFSRAVYQGANTDVLESGVAQTIRYPNVVYLVGEWSVDPIGLVIGTSGYYDFRTRLEMVNSAGCTGTSLMGLSVNLIRNGVVLENSGTDDRLAPVYAESFVYDVSILGGAIGGDRIGFSIKADIKNPQPGCTTKVIAGGFQMIYQN